MIFCLSVLESLTYRYTVESRFLKPPGERQFGSRNQECASSAKKLNMLSTPMAWRNSRSFGGSSTITVSFPSISSSSYSFASAEWLNSDSISSSVRGSASKVAASSSHSKTMPRVIWHLKKVRTRRFAKSVFYFLRTDEKGSCIAIVKGKAVNLGDGEGIQVPCTLHFKGRTKFIHVLQQQLQKSN